MRLFHFKYRRTAIVACIVIIAGIALAVAWIQSGPLLSKSRRQWRDRATAKIQERLNDKTWLEGELSRLRSAAATLPNQGGWVGDEMLVAKSGEWIVCENVCAKEQEAGVRKDLFIGRGSDGKWYYSTFHFCVGKCVLSIEPQPHSLAQLADWYSLVPFDGKSDECLKTTWDGGAYGEARSQSASAGSGPK